ncbi:MAG: hypothetical protein WDO56_03535 [Gammaproteobacteria bacterium]
MIERGSLADQRVIRGTLGTIVELARKHDIQPPALLIVGEVASLAKGAINDVGGENELPATLTASEASAAEPV